MSKTASSLASKYGIQVKQNGHLGSMGLNPNLAMEDEYIENLLKQIHFMNMEIKLLKEKQQQSNDNALWGVVNRTKQPLVANIVESSEKYQQMRKQIDSSINNLEKDIVYLANDQTALLKEINFLEERRNELNIKRENLKNEYHHKNERISYRIGEKMNKFKAVKEEKGKQLKKQKELGEQYEKLLSEDLKEKAKKENDLLQIRNDERIEEMMETEKENEINQLKQKINKLKQLFEQNADYQRALDEQQTLKQKITKFSKQVISANFEIIQLNESISMAEGERDREIKDRKRITQDFENTKTLLQQILFMNITRKDKETMSRKKESVQIQKGEEQTEKLEKSLMEIKKKLMKSEEIHKNIKNQVDTYERELTNLKLKRQSLINEYQEITKINEGEDTEFISVKNQLRQLEDQYEKVVHEDTTLTLELFELQRQSHYLRGRKDFLSENLDLKQTLNGLKVEDLQKVVQKNNDLNATVANFMNKWEDIKNFSRI